MTNVTTEALRPTGALHVTAARPMDFSAGWNSLGYSAEWVLICRSERVLPLSTHVRLSCPFRFVAERQKPLTTATPVIGIH